MQRVLSGLWLLATLAVCLFVTHSLRAAGPEPTFAEWRTACSRLPPNRALNGRLPHPSLLPLREFAALDQLLERFFAVTTNGPLADPARWHGTPPARDPFLDVGRGWFATPAVPFQPFAAKLVVPPDARVLLHGDLHGDIHSLLSALDRLNSRRWLDGFSIIDPKLHMVFLGDYTDRGLYGVEVIYTLLRLKLANPDRVHLVRGNHEDANLVARYGFLAEGQAKYGAAFRPERILRAYDFLPVVLYLGCGSDFVQVCHGGMEPGFNPASLLATPGTNEFQLLGSLRQLQFLRDNPAFLPNPSEAALARVHFQDFAPAAPTTPEVLGFMWNDFTVFADEPGFAHNPDRAFVYGRPAVARLLQSASTGNTRLNAVIRAHQHSGIPNPLMRRLVASKGIFRHWQETSSPAARAAEVPALTTQIETNLTRALPQGSVWTLNVGADSVYGQGCGFQFGTFGLLTFGPRFEEWRLEIQNVDVPVGR